MRIPGCLEETRRSLLLLGFRCEEEEWHDVGRNQRFGILYSLMRIIKHHGNTEKYQARE